MRFLAVLNRTGGTLRTMDMALFKTKLEEAFTHAGHEIETRIVSGENLAKTMEEAAQDRDADVLLAGGGDGTISLAAGMLAHSNKALAILPAGTMNLFARSLQIPLDLDEAIMALAGGHIRQVDIASADGRYFVHQISIGMHPKLIRLRERMEFQSRWGKMSASIRAALATFIRPPNLKIALTIGGNEILTSTAGLSITNNLYGEGHLPYTDQPDGGQLGIYITKAKARHEMLWLLLNMVIGRWQKNDQVEIHEATEVRVKLRSPRNRFKCAIDGEISPLRRETEIKLHPGALNVLVPGVQGDKLQGKIGILETGQ